MKLPGSSVLVIPVRPARSGCSTDTQDLTAQQDGLTALSEVTRDIVEEFTAAEVKLDIGESLMTAPLTAPQIRPKCFSTSSENPCNTGDF